MSVATYILLSNEIIFHLINGCIIHLNRNIYYRIMPPEMDPLFQAMSFFRRRKFEQCVEITTRLLEKNPNDQVKILHYKKQTLNAFNCR